MAETLLQTYLNNQFVKTTEEGNINNLKKAIDELVKQLLKKRTKIIAYTLVAIDPQISENDPVVIEVEKIIIKKWPAFKNNVTSTKDKATTYIRTVILEALTELAKDTELATLIWLSSRNLIQHYKLHKEEEIITSLLQLFANQTEKSGQNLWEMSNNIAMPSFSIPDVEVSKIPSHKNYLIKRLTAAAGPTSIQDGTNLPIEDANAHWPTSTYNWSTSFGEIAGTAIAASINDALKGQNKALSDINDQVNVSLKGLDPFFKEVGKSLLLNSKVTNRRSQLLWWKETLYSSILGKSYRNMSPISSAIVMAIDLSAMVDPIYPESVNYLLKESMKSIYGEQVDSEILLVDLLDKASKMNDQEKSLLTVLSDDQEGRKTFGTALANKLNNDNSNLFEEIGIEKDVKLTLADFSVWIFHDLQSQKIASKK